MIYNNWLVDKESSVNAITAITSSLGITDQVRSVEELGDDTVLQWMDKFSGIDWVCKTQDNKIYGVAVRVQFILDGKESYDSFTIRYARKTGTKTEYEKRIEEIKGNYIYPKYTIQAYFKKETNEIISAAMVLTTDLYGFIKQHPYRVKSAHSDNIFKFVNWQCLIDAEYPIKIYRNPLLTF